MKFSKNSLGKHLPGDLMRRIEVVDGVIKIKCEKCDNNLCCAIDFNKYDFHKEYKVIIKKYLSKIGWDSLERILKNLYDELPDSIMLQCKKRNSEGLSTDDKPMLWLEEEKPEKKLLRKLNKSLEELQNKKNPSIEENRKIDWHKQAIKEMKQRYELKNKQPGRDEIVRQQWNEKVKKVCLPRNKKDIQEVVKACLQIIGGDK